MNNTIPAKRYKNNNMKRIILIFLGLFSLAYGQFSPTGAKTRFVNGISLGTKLDGYYNSADSNAIYWRADSVLRAKYRGTARSLAFQGDTTGFGSRFIYNQFGSNLSAQTAKMYINDTIRTDGRVIGQQGLFTSTSSSGVAGTSSTGTGVNAVLTGNSGQALNVSASSTSGSGLALNLTQSGSGLFARMWNIAGYGFEFDTSATIKFNNTAGGGNIGSLKIAQLSAARDWTLPNLSGTVALMGATNVGAFTAASGGIILDIDSTIYAKSIDLSIDFPGSYVGRFDNSNATGRGIAINAGAGQFDALTIRDETKTDTLLRVKGNGTLLVGDPSSANDSLIVSGTINSVGQITSLSPIVSTQRVVGTTAFQSELSTSALNDSLVTMLGRSANGTYNLMELVQYQRATNQSTGGAALYLFDAGGRILIQKWERDSVVFNRPIIGRGNFTINNNQNATSNITFSNTDNTNTSSRMRIGVTGGTVETIINSIATLGGFIGTASNHPLDIITNGATQLTVSTTGTLTTLPTYNTTVGATNRDVFVDNTGLLGYVSSFRASKKNIAPLGSTSWLHQLNPVKFNYRIKDKNGKYTDSAYKELEYGLIAEEVEPVNKEMVFYDVDSTGKHLRGVHYSKLIIPLLKEVQEQKKTITDLEARVAKLEELIKLIKP